MSLEGRTDLVAPQALQRLRFALQIGDRPGRLLVLLEQLQSFIDGPAAIDDFAVDGIDRTLCDQALALLTAVALRALGLEAGSDWAERAEAFDARPHTPQEQSVLQRYARIAALKTRLAGASTSPTEDEVELRGKMDALYARQQALQAHTTPGDIEIQALDGLEGLLAEYDALRRATPHASSLQPYICFFAASAAFALGRGRALCGDVRAAERAFSEAAALYLACDEPDQADEAQEEAERNRFAADADVDGASLADLRRMADGVPDPLERARTLMRLSDRAAEANDAFSALVQAEAAAQALALAGFPGPEPASATLLMVAPPLAPTLGAWIEAAASRGAGAQTVRLLAWVGTAYLRLASLRGRGRPETDTPATRALAHAVTEFLGLLLEEAQAVHRQVRSALEIYGLATEETSDVPASRTPQATELLALLGEATELDQADALVARADDIGMPILQAQARLTQAIVRWDHDDREGCIAAAQEGEARLLGGRPAPTLIGRPDFAVLLELRRQRLSALAGGGEVQAVFDGAWETVQAIEQARYRISDPFQQGAFLSGRTTFYELAAVSAFKLKRWDDLLTIMDLFKARSALRNRLAPAPTDDGALASKLQAATDACNAASEQDRPALAARRKAIWELLTVSRLGGAQATDLPELSVAAVQATLEPEEAAVTWSFVAADVLIVLALYAGRVHAERIILDDAAQQQLSSFVQAMEAGRVNTRALGRTVSALGETLFPAGVRAFIADARRLILSPHRQLNLIPLHAARLDGAVLIERASVRYAPNLGSLLLPWRGAARASPRSALIPPTCPAGLSSPPQRPKRATSAPPGPARACRPSPWWAKRPR